MNRFASILAIALFHPAAALAASGAPASEVPIVTVCQALRGAAQYSGQTVIVVGRAVDAPEDAWIDEGCGLVLAFGEHRFPAAISTKYDAAETAAPPALPKGFKWDKKAIERALAEVETTSHLQPKTSWCAAYGRLEVNPVRRIDLGNGRFAETVGYGQGGGAAAQLVGPADGVLHLKGK